jgi:iron complex transport system substrate-binding protein
MERGTAKIVLIGAAFLAAAGLSVCLNGLSSPAAPATASAGAGAAREFRYNRVICMSPAVTEIVFALGAGPRVVGVSEYTMYPPDAVAKPTCGGFINPNHERILSLEPDLIVTQGEAADLTSFARDNGIEMLVLSLTDLDSIYRQTRKVGAALQLDAEAGLVCAEMQYSIAKVRARVSHHPPVPAVMVTGHEPGSLNGISVVGPGTFLSDVLDAAGGRNVFADLHTSYAVVSKEALLERAPEVVIELHGEGSDQRARQEEARRLWQGLAPLPAVRDGRVHVLEATYAMIPGPRVAMLAEGLAAILHPEDGQ